MRRKSFSVSSGSGVLLAAVAGSVQCGGGSSGGPSGSSSGSGSGGPHDAGGDARDAGGRDGAGGDAGGCSSASCSGTNRLCCGDTCVNPTNDPFNCGACGTKCTGATSVCSAGSCTSVCRINAGCDGGVVGCCGTQCCAPGQLCCVDEGPVTFLQCVTPTPAQPTCPLGCAPNCVSDRNLKRDIEPVDERAVLATLASVPMSTWSYTSEDPSVRHLGPMAQDFHAAFGLGNTDRAYDPIDAHGVAFAAIQALYEQVREQNARIERLEQQNSELRQLCGR
jgi:Chaperone of endosialidase